MWMGLNMSIFIRLPAVNFEFLLIAAEFPSSKTWLTRSAMFPLNTILRLYTRVEAKGKQSIWTVLLNTLKLCALIWSPQTPRMNSIKSPGHHYVKVLFLIESPRSLLFKGKGISWPLVSKRGVEEQVLDRRIALNALHFILFKWKLQIELVHLLPSWVLQKVVMQLLWIKYEIFNVLEKKRQGYLTSSSTQYVKKIGFKACLGIVLKAQFPTNGGTRRLRKFFPVSSHIASAQISQSSMIQNFDLEICICI